MKKVLILFVLFICMSDNTFGGDHLFKFTKKGNFLIIKDVGLDTCSIDCIEQLDSHSFTAWEIAINISTITSINFGTDVLERTYIINICLSNSPTPICQLRMRNDNPDERNPIRVKKSEAEDVFNRLKLLLMP